MRYWKRLNTDKTTNTVESYSHHLNVEGAIQISKAEYDSFIASLPQPEPQPAPRDLGKEIDSLKTALRLGGYID